MSQDYEITVEDSIHNESYTSIIEVNRTNQGDEDNEETKEVGKYKLEDIYSANFDELDTTNRLYIAKRKDINDAKSELKFEFFKTEKEIADVDIEIKRLQDVYEQLQVKKEETCKIISQQNVFQKIVEKQLDTKSLIFGKIYPSQIEKNSLAVKTLLSDQEAINNSWLEKWKKLQNLLEAKEKLMENNEKCNAVLHALAKNEDSAECEKLEKLHQQKTAKLQALKADLKSADDTKVEILRKLMDENVVINDLMSAEIKAQADILNINNSQQAKIELLYKTLEEKKTNYINYQYNLLPSIQSKKLEYETIFRKIVVEKEEVTKKLDDFNQDLATLANEEQKLEADKIRFEFFYNQETEAFIEKNTEFDKSILELTRKKADLQNSLDEANLSLKESEEAINISINAANNLNVEINEANSQLAELSAANDLIIESIQQLRNRFNDLSDSELNDIDIIEKEIDFLCIDINRINDEKLVKEKVYSEELHKVEAIDLVTLATKLRRLKRENESVIEKRAKKNEKRDYLTTRVTSVELAIQELMRCINKKSPTSLLASKVNARSPKSDVGILKRLGDKSPAKRVHFESCLPGTSSQRTTDDASQTTNSNLVPELINLIDKSVLEVSSSPPTRLQAKKKKLL